MGEAKMVEEEEEEDIIEDVEAEREFVKEEPLFEESDIQHNFEEIESTLESSKEREEDAHDEHDPQDESLEALSQSLDADMEAFEKEIEDVFPDQTPIEPENGWENGSGIEILEESSEEEAANGDLIIDEEIMTNRDTTIDEKIETNGDVTIDEEIVSNVDTTVEETEGDSLATRA